MPKLKPAKRGLSYVEANKGRLITVEGDVLGIRTEIESTWPELSVYFDEWQEDWVVIERCKDGVERFVTRTESLDHRLLEVIRKADGAQKGGHDIEKEVDDWNAKIERERDQKFHEAMGEFAERFAFALKKDGIHDHEEIYGVNTSRKVRRNRVLNR